MAWGNRTRNLIEPLPSHSPVFKTMNFFRIGAQCFPGKCKTSCTICFSNIVLTITWIFHLFFSWTRGKSKSRSVGCSALLKTKLNTGGDTGGPKNLSSQLWLKSCPDIQLRHDLNSLFNETYLWGKGRELLLDQKQPRKQRIGSGN